MAYKALYRKYRPQTFSEVYGQEHITKVLLSELESGKFSHAYLFTGTRGTGKTSCAKILARAVNCLNPKNGDPCLDCEACRLDLEEKATDIVEMDAASNNGVDEVRILREQINFTPANLKYRVYIIDEVHMLSSSAFNALLKTLEEPPEHVIFILATTEAHKLPATILSRCQRFDFHRIENSKIIERINYIAKEEGFTVTEEAANLISAAADGGMRDALSILDLCLSATSEITVQTVTETLGMSGNEYLNRLAFAILTSDSTEALTLIDQLYKGSIDMLRLANELISFFRDIMIVKTVSSTPLPIVCSSEQREIYKELAEQFDLRDILRTLDLLSAAVGKMQTGNRRSLLEMTLIKLCDPALSEDFASLEKRVRTLESGAIVSSAVKQTAPPEERPKPTKTVESKPQDEEISLPEEPSLTDTLPSAEAFMSEPCGQEETPVAEWEEILKVLGGLNPLLVGVLNGSRAFISDGFLLIDAPNPMFRDLVNGNDGYHKHTLRNAATEVLGVSYKLGPYKKKPESGKEAMPLDMLKDKLKELEIPKHK